MSAAPLIQIVPDLRAIADEAARRIVAAAADAIGQSGRFSIALSGGSTPKPLYELLAGAYRERLDWSRIEIFFGDERVVPPDSPESNFRMVNEALLSKIPIPSQNVHRMRGEIDPAEAAAEYGRLLKARFGETGGPDVMLLGMGDDGHTASLFPGTDAYKETQHRCVANFVPRLDAWRITMTAPFINRSELVLILVSGTTKAAVLNRVLHELPDSAAFPVQLIRPQSGRLMWIVDRSAAGK